MANDTYKHVWHVYYESAAARAQISLPWDHSKGHVKGEGFGA